MLLKLVSNDLIWNIFILLLLKFSLMEFDVLDQ